MSRITRVPFLDFISEGARVNGRADRAIVAGVSHPIRMGTPAPRLAGFEPVAEAASKYGVSIDALNTGRQVRLVCPFGCHGDHVGKREISVDTSNPQKVFCCHAYGCQVRGNLL